jgi:hypothetical protein
MLLKDRAYSCSYAEEYASGYRLASKKPNNRLYWTDLKCTYHCVVSYESVHEDSEKDENNIQPELARPTGIYAGRRPWYAKDFHSLIPQKMSEMCSHTVNYRIRLFNRKLRSRTTALRMEGKGARKGKRVRSLLGPSGAVSRAPARRVLTRAGCLLRHLGV